MLTSFRLGYFFTNHQFKLLEQPNLADKGQRLSLAVQAVNQAEDDKDKTKDAKKGSRNQPIMGIMLKTKLPIKAKSSNTSPWLAWKRPKGESGLATRGRKKRM